jgi:hypothetical protein
MNTNNLITGYTSEDEIYKRVYDLAKAPTRTLSAAQLEAIGLDEDPLLVQRAHKQKNLTVEQKMEMAKKWAGTLIANARKQGRLMTEAQLRDWTMGRRLALGDKCRYIGPTREELCSISCYVPRETGQLGFISHIEETENAREGQVRMITFTPNEAVAPVKVSEDIKPQVVDLLVKEYTKGWLLLERIA